MSRIMQESFDLTGDAGTGTNVAGKVNLTAKWASIPGIGGGGNYGGQGGGWQIKPAAARTGARGLQGSSSVEGPVVPLPNAAEYYVGIGCYWQTAFAASMLQFREDDNSTLHVDIRNKNDGTIEVYRNATLLATSTATIPNATFFSLQVRVKVADSGGRIEVRIATPGVPSSGWTTLIDFTGDTTNGGTGLIGRLYLGTNGNSTYWDDLAVNDTAGAVNNSWVGDKRIYVAQPSGAGAHAEWTPLSGSNYANVNEMPQDGDTSYVETTAAAKKDSYAFAAVSPGSASVVDAAVWYAYAKRADANAASIERLYRRGGTDYVGAAQSLTSSYAYYSEVLETDPDGAIPFTVANLNAAEWGEQSA